MPLRKKDATKSWRSSLAVRLTQMTVHCFCFLSLNVMWIERLISNRLREVIAATVIITVLPDSQLSLWHHFHPEACRLWTFCKHKTKSSFLFLAPAALGLHICILTCTPLPWRPSWILNTVFEILLMQMCWRALWSCYYIVNGAKYKPAGRVLWNLLLENSFMLNLESVPLSILFPISHATQEGCK